MLAEHARLAAGGGIDLDGESQQIPVAPLMFALRHADGNWIWVVSPRD
ncbi:hypothetical protein [Cellulomonas fimi]|uniref:Uncharacterized protein n=1 Tax=Cellulomonas fimi TaxID=1708 RepID=A0A7Y0LV74_CELFI|nr:hypothetical protein [Cellulomonas fimi]NMR18822.1 hypothetical protein [Cellulomonas fimi]